ncbi:MAG TPA: polysaccharide biosynthesis tyrosine autokinase, partial [Chitinophagaceae bacterium]|nr:polysaccharide biosynthesis tyrosine autokinase [Chitinophagaceae bacterium]
KNPFYDGTDYTDSELFFSLYRPQNIAGSFLGNMVVGNPKPNSSILYITIVDETPKRAENILNELMNVYSKASVEDKNKVAANTLSFVENRLSSVSHDLDSIENKIKGIRSTKNAYNTAQQGGLLVQNIASSEKEVEGINMQLSVLKQLENFVLSPKTSSSIPSTYGINDPVLGQLVERLYNAETQYIKAKETIGENNPMLATLNVEISKLKPNILEHIQSHRNNLITSRSNLQSVANANTGMLSSMPQKEMQLMDIDREHSIKNNIYTFLLQKREETFLSYASTVADSRVLTSAAAGWEPISPNAKRTYIISILVAFALAIGLITAKEMFSRNVLYRNEIESMTSFPVVGEIAYSKNVQNLIGDNSEKSVLPDQFRKLRTSLTFLGINSKRKKILVTSTIPGEGKSFIAANLGLSLAQAGKKVILLEFDLSQPALSSKMNVDSDEGLVNYLLGEKEPEEIIKRTEAHENLFIISSGPLPPNPSEMILNSKVPELLAYLDGMFDSIIIDSAPVGPMTDAYILASYCDATLYVVRHGYTPKMLVERIDEENKINPMKNAAIVFNAVKTRGFSKSPYGYGYDYTYKYLPNSKGDTKRKRLLDKNNIG